MNKEINSFVNIGIAVPTGGVKYKGPLFFVKRISWLPSWLPFNIKLDYLFDVLKDTR